MIEMGYRLIARRTAAEMAKHGSANPWKWERQGFARSSVR